MAKPLGREFLLDVSRLVWRVWRGGLPTGIDRVCLAYVEQFGARSRAVVQWRGTRLVLSPRWSDRLFSLLAIGSTSVRRDLIGLLSLAVPGAVRQTVYPGTTYLNVGHTGLDQATLCRWIGRRRLRAVYLVHDLIPITHPQFCRQGEEFKHRQRITTILASASGVIGNSQATLDDLRRFARENEVLMPPSVVAWISGNPVPGASPLSIDRPYFVVLGTIEARKNHGVLLAAWRRLVTELGREAPILFIVGRRGWEVDDVLAQLDQLGPLHEHVRELGSCSDATLGELVAGARAMLMPSFVEGFGLPITEALQEGVPVIASDLAVYREIAGEIPTYVRPDDEQAWAATVREFAGDGPERLRQLKDVATYQAPRWSDHFRTVEAWLMSLRVRNLEAGLHAGVSTLEPAPQLATAAPLGDNATDIKALG